MADISIDQLAAEIVDTLEDQLADAWNNSSEPDTTKRAVYKAVERHDICSRIIEMADKDKVIHPYNPLTGQQIRGMFGLDKSWLLKPNDADLVRQRIQSSADKNLGNQTSERPIPRQRFQEDEILRIIESLGYNPQALPPRTPGNSGKPWVKAEVRDLLNFSEKVFDSAWERLRKDKRIMESSPKLG